VSDESSLRYVLAGGFAAAALLAFAAAHRAESRDRHLWLAIGSTMVLLGAAKLLRLQDALTGALRSAAQANGLYVFHREAQAAFALLVILLALAGAVFLSRRLRRAPATVITATAALGAILALLIVRAASIHAIDSWTTAESAGMRRGWWLEAAAAALIAASAAAYRGSRSSGS
jgi:hypothetical protein